ncbi:MAG: RNA polymerase sigma-54 factor, partial [Duncaniella sp.]|nr:RNA polymerase sigma-54 factor [Duncaniella sp.]
MDNSLKLSLGQKLQQKLSPLQIRYGRGLEMNAPEIEEEVRQELDDNPALAVADAQQDDFSDEAFNESAEQLQMADYRDEDDIPSYRLEARNHSVNDVYREPVAVAGGNTLM